MHVTAPAPCFTMPSTHLLYLPMRIGTLKCIRCALSSPDRAYDIAYLPMPLLYRVRDRRWYQALCRNTEGSFQCACGTGYTTPRAKCATSLHPEIKDKKPHFQ
eukprot:2496998-Rhodomonas_salina.2